MSEPVAFSPAVIDFWTHGLPLSLRADRVHVAVDAALTPARSVSLLTVADGPQILALSPDRARDLSVDHGDELEPASVRAALAEAGVTVNDPDYVFHLPAITGRALVLEPPPPGVRTLSLDDRAAFERFIDEAPDDDVDEADVELDHWLVVGRFLDDEIVSAASMYPWDDSVLADTGVLTLPRFRGRGHGVATVRALSASALQRGYEPQYRCQLDNHASVALAQAAGFRVFGSWEVILPDD